MHIEATHYGHRWNNNRRTGATETGPRPSSWSTNSMKLRGNRRVPMPHSQSVQSSSGQHAHVQTQHSVHEFSPNVNTYPPDALRCTDPTRALYADDMGRRFFPTGVQDLSHLPDSSYSNSLATSFTEQQNSIYYRRKFDQNHPDPLPYHIVIKLKERFEKRVLHRHHPHNQSRQPPPQSMQQPQQYAFSQQSYPRRCLSDTKCEDSWFGSVSSFIHSKSEKYQLIAAFLVNKGVVEAWHIYAPLPVDVGHSSDDCCGTRMVELTQRRLRLIQRYYSGARQYVVLYVNSNYAEHYLPMGLARDTEANEPCSHKRTRTRKSSNPDIFHTGNRLVHRLLSSVLKPHHHGRSSSVNEVRPGLDNSDQAPNSPQSEKADRNDSAEKQSHGRNSQSNRLRRNRSLPPYSRSEPPSSTTSGEVTESQVDFAYPSRSVSQTHGSSFIRRVFEHIWSSYARSNHSKSVNFAPNRHGNSAPNRTAKVSVGSAEDVSSRTGDSSLKRDTRVDQHEKESSSSGLIDFSSSTGSTTSDHLALSQPDVLVVSGPRETSQRMNGSNLQEQHQIWLPKHFQTK